MREVAASSGPWREYFQRPAGSSRPDLDPIESPAEFYNALIQLCEKVDIWHGVYEHILPGLRDIVEWVKGTGLQPFMNALPEGEVRDAYLAAYEKKLGELYPRLADEKVMLRYPRLFLVATRI
jgi:trans-aconitate 2-methyltransferase